MAQMAVSEGGRFEFPYTITSALDNTNVGTLQTTNKFLDKDIDIKLTLASAAATVSASKQATSPTIARTSTSASGATNVGSSNATTTAPSSGYFISMQATAPATTLDITKTVGTPGYIGAGTQITASAATTAKTGSVYYIPVTTGVAAANASSASITIETTDDSSKAGVNVQSMLGTAADSEPTSGYFLRIKADGSGSSKVTTAGWFPIGALNTSSTSTTKFYSVTAANVTHSGGGISITTNYSGTPTVSATLTSQTTTGVELTTTEPSSGYYLTITSNSTALSGKTKATRAAYTETFTAGYLPAKNSTNILSSSAVEPTVTIGAGSGVSYLTIPEANPAFDGGTLSGGSTATGTNVTLSSTDNGIKIQTAYTAASTAVLYNGAVEGWISRADNAQALAAKSKASTNGTTYYVTAVKVPKDKGFTVTTTADTALDTTSDLDITNAAYRRVDITNAANGTVLVANSGNTTVTSGSATAGNLTVSAYNASGTAENNKSIVSNGKWVATSVNATGTYYGRVTVGAVSGSIGGTAASGSATAVITNTNSINTITDLTNKTAGTDYWQIKATATGTKGTYTPKYTVNTAGWIASTVTGTAQDVSVTSDSTGKSIYIPKATFTVSGAKVNVSTAGYIASGTVGTISNGTIGTSTSDPGTGYTANTTAVVPSGGYLTLTAGYYPATKISLATLVPNGSNIAGHADYLLAGKTAYDNNGVLVTGNIATYQGDYTYTT